MGRCTRDPRLRRASWLLALTGVLLGVCDSGAVTSRAKDSRAPVSVERVQGGSVLFHVTRKPDDPGAKLEKVSWGIYPARENYVVVILEVPSGSHAPSWVSPQDKYAHRVRLPNMTSLVIDHLTRDDSGLYQARGSFSGGREYLQCFNLTVYEPVPLPRIRVTSVSVTSDWCNVTLDCGAAGAPGDLRVTWRRSDLPEEPEPSGTRGPGPKARPLALSLRRNRTRANLTCALSNPVDRKEATRDLGDVCASGLSEHPSTPRGLLPGLLPALVLMLLVVGAGLYLWKARGKTRRTGSGTGAGPQPGRAQEGDVQYAVLDHRSLQGVRGQRLEEMKHLSSVYCEAGPPGHPPKFL